MNPMAELSVFIGTDKNEYRFVKTVKNHIMVWRQKKDRENEYYCEKLNLSVVNKDILTEAGIWDGLSNKIKESIVQTHEETKAERKERMEHARKQRKKKYDFSHLPEFLTCKCGKQVKGNYYQLQKKADEKQIPLADLVNGYVCQKCCKTRGRKRKNNT